ncbi:MAG: flagellar hook-basal body protein [Verrucomicrobiota bacterium JB022]|nr:flagellar hook-basal body protein [Verrucomicrobiota bacterium JB022]
MSMQLGMVQSAVAMNGLERWQQAVSHNLAAAQVAGFKPVQGSFQATLAGQLPGSTRAELMSAPSEGRSPTYQQTRNFAGGSLRSTDNPNDVALTGEGFFTIEAAGGETLYTRNGEFHVSPENYLVTSNGSLVMGDAGPIQLTPGQGQLKITADGRVSQGLLPLGNLQIAQFESPQKLIPTGGSFRVDPENDPGAAAMDQNAISLAQGFVEESGVQPIQEMVNLITISRAHETHQKIIQSYDQRLQQTIQTLGDTR